MGLCITRRSAVLSGALLPNTVLSSVCDWPQGSGVLGPFGKRVLGWLFRAEAAAAGAVLKQLEMSNLLSYHAVDDIMSTGMVCAPLLDDHVAQVLSSHKHCQHKWQWQNLSKARPCKTIRNKYQPSLLMIGASMLIREYLNTASALPNSHPSSRRQSTLHCHSHSIL